MTAFMRLPRRDEGVASTAAAVMSSEALAVSATLTGNAGPRLVRALPGIEWGKRREASSQPPKL
jgi:hypothetical protein